MTPGGGRAQQGLICRAQRDTGEVEQCTLVYMAQGCNIHIHMQGMVVIIHLIKSKQICQMGRYVLHVYMSVCIVCMFVCMLCV